MSKGWEKFFFLFTFVSQGSSYLSPYGYGVLHRLHHAFTDTEKDPHSPTYDKNLFAMMWKTKVIYSNIFKGKINVDSKFKLGVPKWFKFDRFADNLITRISWGVVYFLIYYFFAPHWWMYILLPLHFFMGPLHGAIINWFAHTFGYRNFKTTDTSKNIMPLDIFMMGEGYHNNHHKFAGRANFGVRWFELDPTYPVIWFLDKIRVIKLRPQPVVQYTKDKISQIRHKATKVYENH